jgi:hypothetical protein
MARKLKTNSHQLTVLFIGINLDLKIQKNNLYLLMFFLIKINFAGLLGFRVPIATFTPQSACISSERTVSTNYTMTRHNYPKRIFPLAEATARIAFASLTVLTALNMF